jgi:hypothetical protein
MPRIFPLGKTRGRDGGYILLDALIMLFLVGIGLWGLLSGFAATARTVSLQRARMEKRVEARNADVVSRKTHIPRE